MPSITEDQDHHEVDMIADIDMSLPALLQIRHVANLKKWMCRPYPNKPPYNKQIPLFYTPLLGEMYPWTKGLAVVEYVFTQGPVWQIFLFWIPLLFGNLYTHLDYVNFLVFGMGLMMWTLIEYLVHRFVFHSQVLYEHAPEMLFLVHFVHHKQPFDSWRMTMPLAMSIPLGSVIVTLAYFLLFQQHFVYTYSWSLGFLLGYIMYDFCHFLSHYAPSFLFFQKHHLAHHGLCHRKFGFTTSLWDRLFHTD